MGKFNTRHPKKRMQRHGIVSKEMLLAGPDEEISTSIESNKKRKASNPPTVESEKKVKKNKKTNSTHDKYCWKCHKIDVEIGCSMCPRAFHPSCIKAKMRNDDICYVCQQESSEKATSNIDDEYFLSQLLVHVINTACPMDREEYKPIINWPDSVDNEKLICKKDFRLIHDRCTQRGFKYESHVELVEDVKWIIHNCMIIYGGKSRITETAKKVLKVIEQELKDARDCPECYFKKIGIGNEALSFLHICKTPHPLVWAKVKFHPYWPAKCLRVVNGKAHVRFFHTHQMSDVPLSNVLALSKEYPASNAVKKPDKRSKISGDFYFAEEELEAYIDIFQGHYGSFPYEPLNTSFDFEKEENIIKDLLENHSRRRILSGDTFSPPAEAESSPALVDLTEEVIQDDEEQQLHENVSSPVNEETQHFFEDQVLIAVGPPNVTEEEFLDSTSSATEVNNSLDNDDNDQSLMDDIENDPTLKSGFQDSVDVFQAENSTKTIKSIEAISGSLLPSRHTLNSVDHQNLNWLSQPSGISISNVISGTEVPMASSPDLFPDHCEAEPAMQNSFVMSMPSASFQNASSFPRSSTSSSSSMQLCLRNYDRASDMGGFRAYPPPNYPNEDVDIEIIDEVSSSNAKTKINKNDSEFILQTILRHDPRAYSVLKQANALVQQLFIQFWGSSLKTPEKIIQSQAAQVRSLKTDVEEMRKQISVMSKVYEDRIANAGSVFKSMYEKAEGEKNVLAKKLKDKEEELKKKNEIIEDLEKNELQSKNEIKKLQAQIGEWKKLLANKDKDMEEKVNHAKTFKYPKEREDVSAGQRAITRVQQSCHTFTLYQQSLETHSVQSHIASGETSPGTSQQANSTNVKGYKVVAAKKTLEIARNINKNQNSSDIY